MSIERTAVPRAASVLALRPLWLALGFGFVLLVIYLSLTPDRPDMPVPQGWKMGHVLAYTWLMLWYAQIYQRLSSRLRIAALFCCMGIALEYVQGLTVYRTFAYFDMLLNASGILFGLLLGHTRLRHALTMLDGLLLRSVWMKP